MKRRLTQSIAGLLLVCMAGSTVFGAANVTRQGAPTPQPTTTAPSTGAAGKAPTQAPNKAPAMPSSSSAPVASPTTPSTKPSTAPTTTPSTKPSTAPTTTPSTKPSTKPSTAPTTAPSTKPSTAPTTAPSTKPSTAPTTAPSTKPSTCPNKPGTCPNKPQCPNKQQPFALDNFKVIQATLASCGVDEQELAAYIKQGKKLEDVLKEENISVRKFKKRVLKEYCKVIDEAVKSGQLTNEQGAQLKEAIKDTVKNWLPKNN